MTDPWRRRPAFLSPGLAAVVRDSAAAIRAVLGLLYLRPILTQMVRLLEQLVPMSAGLVLAAWSAGTQVRDQEARHG
jgi:ABC-2 type transport system permease protein